MTAVPVSLASLASSGLLLIGFSIEGGAGTQPRAEAAGFVLWDPVRDAEVWRGDLGLENIHSVRDLCPVRDDLVYALALPREEGNERDVLLLLDLASKSIVSSTPLTEEVHRLSLRHKQSLFVHGGYVYGATDRTIFRAGLETTDLGIYWRAAEKDRPVSACGAVLGSTWHFASGHRLCALQLPSDRQEPAGHHRPAAEC